MTNATKSTKACAAITTTRETHIATPTQTLLNEWQFHGFSYGIP